MNKIPILNVYFYTMINDHDEGANLVHKLMSTNFMFLVFEN